MVKEATSSGSRSQLFFATVWLVTTVTLLLMFQTVGVSQALGADGDNLVDTGAADFPLSVADPTDEPLPSALYGGVMWSVVDVRIQSTEVLLDHAVIEVDVSVRNTLTTTPARVSDRLVSLVARTGDVVTDGRYVDAGTRLTLAPGETQDVTIMFKTGFDQDPDPANLSLRISEPNRIPTMIPLVGRAPKGDFPIFLAVESVPTALADPADPQRQIVVEPEAATLNINAGPYRAAEGEQLAVVKVNVQRTATLELASYLEPSYWGLEADGELEASIMVARRFDPEASEDEVTLLFAFSADAEELTLVAAPGTPDAAIFRLVIPAAG